MSKTGRLVLFPIYAVASVLFCVAFFKGPESPDGQWYFLGFFFLFLAAVLTEESGVFDEKSAQE